jgi:tetratricopeptide (TPR) repeat protein
MKTKYLLILLFCNLYSFSQTEGDYKEDEIVHINVSQTQDKLHGYPNYSDINEKAIEWYNKATNIIYTDTDLAVKYYLSAIKIDLKFVQAYDNIGKIYRMLEEYDLSIKYYKKSIEIFPNGDVAHGNLALVYKLQDKFEDAINEYKKVIEIQPNSPEGYYGIAGIYLYQEVNELELALINAKKALDIYINNPPNYIGDSYAQVGLIYYYLGNNAKAKTYIQIAKEKYIENNFEQVFKDTFPSSMLIELSIE